MENLSEKKKEAGTNQLTFWQMLKKHKKYEDLYKTIEGNLSIAGGFLIALFFYFYSLDMVIEDYNELLSDISFVFIPSLLGLLGIIFAGLTFASGTVSLKATEKLFEEKKIGSLVGIFFSFYFAGWLIAIAILLYVCVFFLGLTSLEVVPILVFVFAFIVGYFTLFVIFYTVGLFDTCIKLFFVNYLYNKDNFKEESKDN